MKFAERLWQERIANGYTQVYIAKDWTVSKVAVSNGERGAKEPDYQTLIDLAKLFNRSTDYMLGLTDK